MRTDRSAGDQEHRTKDGPRTWDQGRTRNQEPRTKNEGFVAGLRRRPPSALAPAPFVLPPDFLSLTSTIVVGTENRISFVRRHAHPVALPVEHQLQTTEIAAIRPAFARQLLRRMAYLRPAGGTKPR